MKATNLLYIMSDEHNAITLLHVPNTHAVTPRGIVGYNPTGSSWVITPSAIVRYNPQAIVPYNPQGYLAL